MIDGLGFPVALQFKADGKGGYLYRKDQVGPGIAATAAERDRHVRWMGWMVILSFFGLFAGVIAMAVIAEHVVTSDSNTVGVFGAMVMAVIAMGSLYLFLLWASHAPARAFAGRPEVEPAKSPKQVFGRRMARVSYTRIAGVTAGLLVFMLFAAAGDPEVTWVAVILPLAVGLGYAIWKWRIENGD